MNLSFSAMSIKIVTYTYVGKKKPKKLPLIHYKYNKFIAFNKQTNDNDSFQYLFLKNQTDPNKHNNTNF